MASLSGPGPGPVESQAMDLSVLLNPLNARSDALACLLDPSQKNVRLWALEDELLRKASTYTQKKKASNFQAGQQPFDSQ